MQIINYLTHIPAVVVAGDYKEQIFNGGTGETPIFVKSDGYPMQLVQLKLKIDELDIKHWEYRYACPTNGLDHDQREAQNGSRSMGRL